MRVKIFKFNIVPIESELVIRLSLYISTNEVNELDCRRVSLRTQAKCPEEPTGLSQQCL